MRVSKEVIARTLDLELGANDAEAKTVRAYLVALLHDVWLHEEGFDGKRPFGNSGRQYEVYKPMIATGIVNGILDRDGYVEQFDEYAAEQVIMAAIDSMALPPKNSNYIL